MRGKKILVVVSDVYFSKLLLEICRKLHTKHDVSVIVLGSNSKIFVKDLNDSGLQSFSLDNSNRYLFIRNIFAVWKQIHKGGYKVVISSGRLASYLVSLLPFWRQTFHFISVRHFTNVHHNWRNYRSWLLDQFVNLRSYKIVAVSSWVKDVLTKHEFFAKSKVVVIHNGIPVDEFAREVRDRRVLDSERIFTIGLVARFEEKKGIRTVIEVIETLKLQDNFEFQFRIAGAVRDFDDKPVQEHINKLVASGILRLDDWKIDIYDFYRDIDVIMHIPSDLQYEAFGMVYIEGLISGIPCIFVRSGILLERQELKPYYFEVASGSPRQIVDLIRNCHEVWDKQETVPKIPLNLVKDFDLNETSQKYLSLIDNLSQDNL